MLNSSFSYQSPTFQVSGNLSSPASLFSMQVNASDLMTGSFPHTLPILKKYIPSILKSQCFNSGNLPFRQEVKNTNFAHLFEHLLIEHLCLVELSQGACSVDFSGVTSWDWNTSPRGSYSISLSVSSGHEPAFRDAFSKSIFVLEKVFNSNSKKSRQLN